MMNADAVEREPNSPDGMADAVRKQQERRERWRTEGEPSVVRFVGQIGVLGWIIVAPTLIGLFVGRWFDHALHTGIFWSAALLVLGVTLGFWSAWRWMQRQSLLLQAGAWLGAGALIGAFFSCRSIGTSGCWPLDGRCRSCWRCNSVDSRLSPAYLPPSRFGALPLLLAAAGILAARAAAVRFGEQT
jgi:ATP synthase protein I